MTVTDPGRVLKPRAGQKTSLSLMWKTIVAYKYIYLMLLFPIAFFVIFRYLPMYGLQLAFKEYNLKGMAASPWVGLEHFRRMLDEPDFFRAFYNTVIISILRIVVGFPFPIILSLMINEIYMPKYRRVLQTIYTFPHFLSWVVVAGICLNLFGNSGAVRKIAMLVTGNDQAVAQGWDFLYNSHIFRSFLVGTDIWKEAGWGTIIYLACIAGVDQQLYEAATIDGCNRFQKIVHITIPGIMGMIVIQFLLRVGSVMDGGFDQIFNMYSAPVFPVADTIDTYIYRNSFQSGIPLGFGYTTAVGLLKNVINFALLLGANQVARRLGHDGII